jgi:tripartite-type tricarboxylate transporter receptor subunit TctC
MPYVQSGRLRALGVTSAKRVSATPQLPTIAEAGLPGYEYVVWYGVLGPAGMPADIVGRLNSELVKIARQPDMKEKLTGEGGDVVGSSPEEFAAFIKRELQSSATLVKAARVKPD